MQLLTESMRGYFRGVSVADVGQLQWCEKYVKIKKWGELIIKNAEVAQQMWN